MRMSRSPFVACVLFALLGLASDSSQPFSLTISPEKPEVKAGSDIWVNITMTNNSDHDVDCSSWLVAGTDLRYQYDIRDGQGNAVKKKNEHPEAIPGSVKMCTLNPGQNVTRQSRIGWVHDVSRPDKYMIQVSRWATENEKDGVVKSNTITVTVAPKQ